LQLKADAAGDCPVIHRAIDVGDPTFRAVKDILIAGTETDTTTTTATAPAPVAPAHLHGPTRIFVINDKDSPDSNVEQRHAVNDDSANSDLIALAIITEIGVPT
jgi:hypothetical protein